MPLTGKDMAKLPEQNGFVEIRVNGSHHIYFKKDAGETPVPIHTNRDLKKGTESKILKMAGLK